MSYVFCYKGFFVKYISLFVLYYVFCIICSEVCVLQYDDFFQQFYVYWNIFGNIERIGGCCRKSFFYYGINDVYNLKCNLE